MSGIRHDRSVIDAYGGIWPGVARKLGEECQAIASGLPPTMPQKMSARPPPRCEMELRRRRLGLTQRGLATLAGVSADTVKRIEAGRYRYAGAVAMVKAALERAENTK